MLKKFIISLGVLTFILILLAGVGAFFGLRYLNSPEFKRMVSTKVKDVTGIYADMDSVRIGLFGIDLENIQIPNVKPYATENVLSVRAIHLNIDWFSAFKEPLTVRKIEVDSPVVILRQRPEGGFYLPFPPDSPSAPQKGRKSKKESGGESSLSLPDIVVKNARVSVFAPDKSLLFATEDANLRGSYEKRGAEQSARGDLTVKKAVVTPGYKVTDFRTPVTFENQRLRLTKIVASNYQGALAGEAGLNLSLGSFDARLNLAGVDMSELLSDLGNPPDTIKGRLLLNFQGKGFLSAARDLTGNGNLKISEPEIGKLKSYNQLVSVLGTVAGISALRDGKFDEITSRFSISGQKIQLQPLDVVSPNLSIFLKGPFGFDKSLNLEGTVELAPGLMQVGEAAGAVSGLLGGGSPAKPGESSQRANVKIPLTITGTAAEPKVSLTPVKVDGEQLKNGALNLLNSKPAEGEKKPGVEGLLNGLLH